MNEKDKKRISKFLSLVLRHQPDYIDLQLDKNGWAYVDALMEKSKTRNIHFSKDELYAVVKTNDKQRFAFNDDSTMIRANQGHSLKTIDLKLEPVKPPNVLYHGTVEKFIDAIKQQGLIKRSRQHVHLSDEITTATKVGSRRGQPIILKIDSAKMNHNEFTFYRSLNGVWLTDHVPVEFISF